jgi:hypothetical protein
MNGATRRTFLKTTGAGAAAVGAAALVPATPASATTGENSAVATPVLDAPATASGSLVAYVHDVASGEVSVMVEGREVTVTDHQLVAKLAQVLRSPAV